MYRCRLFSRFVIASALVLMIDAPAVPALAQAPTAEQHEHATAAPDQDPESHDMQMARDGSGTS